MSWNNFFSLTVFYCGKIFLLINDSHVIFCWAKSRETMSLLSTGRSCLIYALYIFIIFYYTLVRTNGIFFSARWRKWIEMDFGISRLSILVSLILSFHNWCTYTFIMHVSKNPIWVIRVIIDFLWWNFINSIEILKLGFKCWLPW